MITSSTAMGEREQRRIGRAKRKREAALEEAAKEKLEAQLERDRALVARNLALQALKAKSVEPPSVEVARNLVLQFEEAMPADETVQFEEAMPADQTARQPSAEAEALAALEQARTRVSQERAAEAELNARLKTALAQAAQTRIEAERARARNGTTRLGSHAALQAIVNGVARAPASPKDKPRLAATPQTVTQTAVGRTPLEKDATDPSELERRRQKRVRFADSEGEARPDEEREISTRYLQHVSARTRARRGADVEALLGSLWTARTNATAQAAA